ncbi:extracellular solute-binding protein [Paenibacillus hemerocallicola]|nr:extracellular solute-binding protein [Paenibacillus hemerocallicola]
MRSKKHGWVPAVLVGAAAIMTACGDSGNAKAGDAPTDSGESASFTILNNDGGESYAKQAMKDDIFYKEMSRLFSEHSGKPTQIAYEFLPAADFSQQVTVRFASKAVTEVIATTSITDKGHPTAVENGVFTDLTALIDQYGPNLKKNIPEYIWKNPRVSKDGKIYGIPKMLTPLDPRAFLVRKDWLDKLGMKQPETLDDYLAFFERVKREDVNGNGDPNDEVGFIARSDLGQSQIFFAAFDLFPGVWHVVNGQFIPDIINPKMKDAIRFYKLLYDKGYMNKDWITTKQADWSNEILNDKVATWQTDLRQLAGFSKDSFASKKGVVDVLPGFRDESGTFNLGYRGLGIAKVHVVLSTTKHPERFVQFMDWTYSNDQKKTDFFAFGIKGRNYTEENGAINWEGNNEMNKKEKTFVETMINPSGDSRMDIRVIEKAGIVDPSVLKRGTDYTAKNMYDDPSINMELPEVLQTKPELGYAGGSLFMDMFSRVVTGKEQPDAAFDKFVADWKKRGGDEAVKQATEWYNKNGKK